LAFLLIAHDLSVVGQISDRVAVMYLGRIVEIGTRDQVFTDPQHPYTMALLSAVPSHEKERGAARDHIVLKGDLPNPMDPPTGCRFRTRCWRATDLCATQDPPLAVPARGTQEVACHFPGSVTAATADTDQPEEVNGS
jgi:oligopeptide/dipeptide ABC transporter ATP-binding protein